MIKRWYKVLRKQFNDVIVKKSALRRQERTRMLRSKRFNRDVKNSCCDALSAKFCSSFFISIIRASAAATLTSPGAAERSRESKLENG